MNVIRSSILGAVLFGAVSLSAAGEPDSMAQYQPRGARGEIDVMTQNQYLGADLAPLLEGVVSNASGVATGVLKFSWASSGVRSSGDFALAGVSFNGPTLAVTRTNGLTGEIAFESLAPLKTKGVQTITIGRVDLDALKLDQGEMTFELPGDETIRIVKAEFPWFGGRIGAYETTAPLGGQSAVTRLEIDAVNLFVEEVGHRVLAEEAHHRAAGAPLR